MREIPAPPPEHTAGRRTRWALLGGAFLGCGFLLGLIILGVGLATYFYVSAPSPSTAAANEERKVTPTHATRQSPEKTDEGSSLRELFPAETPEAEESDETEEIVPLAQDHERRARISQKVAEALEQRGPAPQYASGPEQPALNTDLPQPMTLTRATIDAKLPKSPRLAELFDQPIAWSIGLDGFNDRIHAADFDNDGAAELLFIDFDGRRAMFYEGDPQNGYGLVAVEAIDGWPQQDVITEDFNGDGLVDVLIPGGSSRTTMLLNDGNWDFTYGLFMVQWAAASAQSLDLNDDGSPDFVFGNAKEIESFVNDGQGAFRPGGRPYALAASHMIAADISGDGVAEIIAAPFFNWNEPPDSIDIRVLSLPRADSPTITGRTLDYHVPVWRLIPFRPRPDSPVDLFTTATGSGEFIRLVNNGSGEFTPESLGRLPSSTQALAADINRDGFEDLIVGTRVFLNENGTLASPVRFSTNQGHRPIAYADMDGDGFGDMLYFDWNRQGVLIYPGKP